MRTFCIPVRSVEMLDWKAITHGRRGASIRKLAQDNFLVGSQRICNLQFRNMISLSPNSVILSMLCLYPWGWHDDDELCCSESECTDPLAGELICVVNLVPASNTLEVAHVCFSKSRFCDMWKKTYNEEKWMNPQVCFGEYYIMKSVYVGVRQGIANMTIQHALEYFPKPRNESETSAKFYVTNGEFVRLRQTKIGTALVYFPDLTFRRPKTKSAKFVS